MTDQTTDPAALMDRLRSAVTAMPTMHKDIDEAEQAIRDAYGQDDPYVARRMIQSVHDEAENGWRIDYARTAAHAAFDQLTKAVADARRALGMAAKAYDVEIVETGANTKIEAALTHIELLVDGARANVPTAGA